MHSFLKKGWRRLGARPLLVPSRKIGEVGTVATILVVDDDAALVRSVAEALIAAGHTCQGFHSAEAAYGALDRTVDLLILDIMMPGLSGFELCRRVRASADCFTLPILFLSAIDTEEEIAHGLDQGANDFLTKPVPMPELLRRVESLLVTQSRDALTDTQTALPGSRGIKLELQRLINRNADFDAVYVEFLNLAQYGRVAGAEERGRAVRHLSRMVTLGGQGMPEGFFHAGHLGGGHFLCLTPLDQSERFAKQLHRRWREHVPRLLDTVEGGKTDTAATALDTVVCTLRSAAGEFLSARDVLENLNHIRQPALRAGPGVYMERRLKGEDRAEL